MQENLIKTPRSARYVTLGLPTEALKQVFFLFHGYGQLATSFIGEFSYIAHGSRYFVAPEGLSKFYLSGSSGKVGASWMTSEERDYEISDYLHFLDSVYQAVNKGICSKDIESILLGFSQGVATVCRWLEKLKIPADKLILWAGTIPPEVDLWQIKAHYPNLEVFLVAGTKDPLIRSDVLLEQESRLEKAALHYRKIRFEGKHELHPPTLLKII
jgi:predicted esterase